MSKYSVLQNFTPDCLKLDPFPYIHIPQVLPWDLYEQLEAEYPEQFVTGGTEHGFGTARYQQHDFDYEKVVSTTWRDFVEYNTSIDFKNELITVFREAIQLHYTTAHGWPEDLYTKYINSDVTQRMVPKKGAIKMEMQFVCNAIDQVHIRKPHVDQARELFACLFYFKKPEDKGSDGGLNVYRSLEGDEWRKVDGRVANREDIEVVDHIPYARNTLACFLNTKNSLHGVDPRENPNTIRRYINIDGHVSEKLFKF